MSTSSVGRTRRCSSLSCIDPFPPITLVVTRPGRPLLGRRTPRHAQPRVTIRRHPKGPRMPKRAIYQRKVDGKWAMIELPDHYKDGDRLPVRSSTDQWFDARDEARAELLR